jgi:hypothetical protein
MLDIETFNTTQESNESVNGNVINNFFENCKEKLSKFKTSSLNKKFNIVNRLSTDFNKVASISSNIPEIYFIEVFENNSFKVVFNCKTQYLPVFIIEGEE